MDWWIWIFLSDNNSIINLKLLNLWKNFLSSFRARWNDMKGPYSFTIQTHIFSKWLRDNHLKSLFNKISNRPSIFFKVSCSKTLICWIKERNKTILFHNICNLFPLSLSRINTCWIMSTCMKEYNWASDSIL